MICRATEISCSVVFAGEWRINPKKFQCCTGSFRHGKPCHASPRQNHGRDALVCLSCQRVAITPKIPLRITARGLKVYQIGYSSKEPSTFSISLNLHGYHNNSHMSSALTNQFFGKTVHSAEVAFTLTALPSLSILEDLSYAYMYLNTDSSVS